MLSKIKALERPPERQMSHMTDKEVSIRIPAGRRRGCGQYGALESRTVPGLAGNGSILIRGQCEGCGGQISTFFKVTPLDVLANVRLAPLQVALVAMGIKAGYEAARAAGNARRNDDIYRVQQRLRLSYGRLGQLFQLNIRHVAAAVADARKRANDTETLHKRLLLGWEDGRTYEQLSGELGLSPREVGEALAAAKKLREEEAVDNRMLREEEAVDNRC